MFFAWDTLDIPTPQNKRESIIYSETVAFNITENGQYSPGSFFHVKKAVDGFEAGGGGGLNGINNWRLIRYSDVLLMYAEALNELGNSAEAISHINKIRERARNTVPIVNGKKVFRSAYILRTNRPKIEIGDFTGQYSETTISGGNHNSDTSLEILSDYPCFYKAYSGHTVDFNDVSKTGVRKMIVKERRVELAFEYLRFLDMRRWEAYDSEHPGAASKVFLSKTLENSLSGGNDKQPYNKNIHNLFPIPQKQIDLSQGTTIQNIGY